MDPLTQRLITVVAGILASWIAQHVPGVDQPTANELSVALLSFSVGWAIRHFADAAPAAVPAPAGERK